MHRGSTPSDDKNTIRNEDLPYDSWIEASTNQGFSARAKSIYTSSNLLNKFKEYEKSIKYAQLMTARHQDEHWTREKDKNNILQIYQAEFFLEAYANQRLKSIEILTMAAEFYFLEAPLEQSCRYFKSILEALGSLTINMVFNLVTKAAKTYIQPLPISQEYKAEAINSTIDYYFNARFILSHKEMPFNFIFCPKNACTSIKSAFTSTYSQADRKMITADPHGAANCYLHEGIDFGKEFIILTRNPYSRFISAFINKISPGLSSKAFIRICEKYGFNKNDSISMEQLLDAFLYDEPNLIDGHFRPQFKIFCSSCIIPAKIFSLERVEELQLYIKRKGVHKMERLSQSNNKNTPLPQDLEKGVRSKIYQLYEKDFIVYGYLSDPSKLNPIRPNSNCQHIFEFLSGSNERSIQSASAALRIQLFNDPFLRSKNYSIEGFINNLMTTV